MSQENRRNVTDLYHPITIRDLQLKFPVIPWKDYIHNFLGIEILDEDETVILRVLPYFENLEKYLVATPKR